MGLIDSIFAQIHGQDKEKDAPPTFRDDINKKAEAVAEKKAEAQKSKEQETAERLKLSREAVYEKIYECPVCFEKFKDKTLRTGKYKLKETELDLKPHFEPLHAEYYSVLLCSSCGYAAPNNTFDKVGNAQINLIKKYITPKFKNMPCSDILTPEQAIFRNEQAIKCSEVKKGKDSERAYLKLRIAWIYRDLDNPEKEMEYIKAAYEDFTKATANEYYPMSGLDEPTVLYIMSTMAYRLGEFDTAKKILGSLVRNRSVSFKMKEKIEDFRDLIKKATSSNEE